MKPENKRGGGKRNIADIAHSPSVDSHIWLLGLLTPALSELGNFSEPMLKSMPMELPTKRMAKKLTPAIRKKGELMSFFWQAEPPHWIVFVVPSLFLTMLCWHLHA